MNKMLMGLVVFGVLMGGAICAAGGQSEPGPSARRVYLLCQAEDPSCGPILMSLYEAALRNGDFRGTKIGCARYRPLALSQIYAMFMNAMGADLAFTSGPGWGGYSLTGREGMIKSISPWWCLP